MKTSDSTIHPHAAQAARNPRHLGGAYAQASFEAMFPEDYTPKVDTSTPSQHHWSR